MRRSKNEETRKHKRRMLGSRTIASKHCQFAHLGEDPRTRKKEKERKRNETNLRGGRRRRGRRGR
jgi:hypothetical protein